MISRQNQRRGCRALLLLVAMSTTAAAFQSPSISSHGSYSNPTKSFPPSFRSSFLEVPSKTLLHMSDRTMDQQEADSSTLSSTQSSSFDFTSHQTGTNPQTVAQRRLFNGLVLGSLVTLTLYLLTHSQLEALFALWEYDLGQINSGDDVTKASVAAEVMLRLPLDALHSYERLVPKNPIFYKACTSGVAYALGDFVSQVVQGKQLEDIDLPRSFRSGAAGFIGHGPLCHYWLTFMETYLDFGGAWWATGVKVTADLTVWSIFLCSSYSFIIGMLEMRDPRDVWKDVKATTWPALKSAWRFWPFVHTISFSHAVPMDLKLLWVDIMEVIWVTILSKVANEDKNAARELENIQEEEAITTTMAAADATKGSTDIVTATIETEDVKDDSLELPVKILAACWPLIAMWPVLYAGYQIEVMLGLEV